MGTIYILDDQEFVREKICASLKQFNPEFIIHQFGDEDDSDDCRFVSEVIKLKTDNSKLSTSLVIIDVRMDISDEWIEREKKEREERRTSYWAREFKSASAHGFNIYNTIRSECGESLKIATITVHSMKEVLQCREGKPLPPETKYYRHIHAVGHYENIARELYHFFKS